MNTDLVEIPANAGTNDVIFQTDLTKARTFFEEFTSCSSTVSDTCSCTTTFIPNGLKAHEW